MVCKIQIVQRVRRPNPNEFARSACACASLSPKPIKTHTICAHCAHRASFERVLQNIQHHTGAHTHARVADFYITHHHAQGVIRVMAHVVCLHSWAIFVTAKPLLFSTVLLVRRGSCEHFIVLLESLLFEWCTVSSS